MVNLKTTIQKIALVDNPAGIKQLTSVKTRDGFMKTRNALLSLLQGSGLTVNQINGLLKKYSLLESNIPATKLGSGYDEEFKKLWYLTSDAFALLVRPDLGEKFRNNVPVWNDNENSLDFVATLLKGANHPIAKKAEADRYAKLLPLVPVLKQALQDKGIYPPSDVPELAQLFYNTFIAKAQSENEPLNFDDIDPAWQSHLDESIVNAIVTYANSLAQRKESGEVLPKSLDKIATTTQNVKEQLGEKAKQEVAKEIGTTFMSNYKWLLPVIIGVILVLAYLAIRK